MAAKMSKLEDQFVQDAKKDASPDKDSSSPQLFKDVAIFVNGYTDPSADQLKRIMMVNGGTFHHYFNDKKTTHIIAINLPDAKVERKEHPLLSQLLRILHFTYFFLFPLADPQGVA